MNVELQAMVVQQACADIFSTFVIIPGDQAGTTGFFIRVQKANRLYESFVASDENTQDGALRSETYAACLPIVQQLFNHQTVFLIVEPVTLTEVSPLLIPRCNGS